MKGSGDRMDYGSRIIHIDVGYSRQVANILGIQPTALILCGAKDGATIRDDRTAIKVDGHWPAACTCGACQRIAEIMHDYDVNPAEARTIYRKQDHSEEPDVWTLQFKRG